jgi:crotonobetainyl-CoA:carnitine CoA-transferase CaiB-like acyl-CoA transferase
MYAAVGILAALHHRDRTGEGQHIDLALVDTQLAWLINEGTNYLESDQLPTRRGNGHPNIVPYNVFAAADGHVIVAVGNDSQFGRFCDFLARIANRKALMAFLSPMIASRSMADTIAGLEARKVPVGPVNTLDAALGSDQALAREMTVRMDRADIARGHVTLLGNPLKMSRTPVSYRLPPPHFGQDSAEILGNLPPDP